MIIRNATINDLSAIAEIEAVCFPAAEAASEMAFKERLQYYADCFWLLYVNENFIGFIDGMRTDEADLSDFMYENASLHKPQGRWQMIFGLNVLPQYRCKGYAGLLIKHIVAEARKNGCEGVVLTCKERLLHYYEKFGFVNEGVSASVHGNVVWYQMRLRF